MNITKLIERLVAAIVIASIILIAATVFVCRGAEVPVTVQKSGTNVVITLPASAYDGAFEVLGVTNNAKKAEAIRRITLRGIASVESQARVKVEQRVRAADMNKLKAISQAAQ